MKIAVLIPDRNDRPKLLENSLRMLKAQSVQPDIIELVNDEPLSSDVDITWRYRIGYDRLRNKGVDIIFLWENDDWYHPDYIKIMLGEWIDAGKPDIFGTDFTIYYHIKLFAYIEMQHAPRASAMNTMIKPDLQFSWCADNEPYTDLHLWETIKGSVFTPEKYISLGIKHGEGLCGGASHTSRLHRYTNFDSDKKLLRSCMDPESFSFYTNYFNNEKHVF